MENNENYKYMVIIGIIYLINCIFIFLIKCTICSIHFREPIMRANFYKVVFIQLILETILDICLILIIIIILISHQYKEWLLLFQIILNFCINTDVLYNIVILTYLIFKSYGQKDSDDEDNDKDETINLRNSISFRKHSFKFIHICSLCLGGLHTLIFFLIRDKNKYNFDSLYDWFYFFYPIKISVKNSFIFINFCLLLLINIPYLFISLKRLKITNYIHLKHYCIHCILGAIISLIIPITKVCIINMKNKDIPLLFFSSAFFLLYLNCLCVFRYNCFYVDHILSSNGNELKNKIKLFIDLMLFRIEVPKPNFIDFNNPFIYHSLAYESDFLSSNRQETACSVDE